jgi:hypothetical protein
VCRYTQVPPATPLELGAKIADGFLAQANSYGTDTIALALLDASQMAGVEAKVGRCRLTVSNPS